MEFELRKRALGRMPAPGTALKTKLNTQPAAAAATAVASSIQQLSVLQSAEPS